MTVVTDGISKASRNQHGSEKKKKTSIIKASKENERK